MQKPSFTRIERLTIVGTGMIGASLALALKRRDACGRIRGYDISQESLRQALEMGVIDDYETDLGAAVADADVVALALPIIALVGLMPRLAVLLPESAVVTDVGSAKGVVVAAARERLSRRHLANFVPGHPVAGREQSGVGAGDAELFVGRTVIITPLRQTSAAAKQRVGEMWRQAGAKVTEMQVKQHDQIMAAISHLPHVLAYSLVDCLASMETRYDLFAYAAGGFADFSRIASSDPQMWRDICLANRDALLRVLGDFDQHLQALREAVEESDGERLLQIFRAAKQARDRHTSGQ